MMNMQAGIPKAQLMAGDAMNRALTRMAHEMMEQLMPLENVVLVGIRRRGVPLAQRLSDIIEKYEHVRIPVGEVDIAMYRDDRDPAQLNVEVQEKHLPVDVTGKVVVLVDDVLHTGRTVRAAMDAILDQGRAARICLAVLIDRGHRELPIRAGEIGLVHRHELRGALHGLFRVRCFNQDDAHLFVRPDQLTDEIVGVVNLIDSVYQKFGFKYHVELSTRPEDSMGSDEDWARAEEGLRTALEKLGMDYEVNEGDGAFYGPKIDFHLEDSLGRTWQCGTVQLDFQMPLNFDLEYVDADGTKKRPIMLHRVCFGSIERFIGILTEHFAGKFPTWMAPVQVKVLPVSDKSMDYAKTVYAALRAKKIRCELDDRNEKIGYKIREARQVDRVPYMLILGGQEVENNTVSVRDRATDQTVTCTLDEFIAKISKEIADRV